MRPDHSGGATRLAELETSRGVSRVFVLGLVAAFLLGLGVRVAYTEHTHEPDRPGFLVDFDPIYYHAQANAVADGRGFIAPLQSHDESSAAHPPLLVVALASASFAGFDGFHAHRLLSALFGACAVPLTGLLGAQLAGRRVGLLAALIAAVYPGLWANDGLIMPESLYAVLTALVLLGAYRASRAYTVGVAAWLGAAIGLAALTRGEAALLIPLLVVPLAVRAPGLDRRRRVAAFAITSATAIVVVLPWTLYNLARFEKPVFISTAVDGTFGGANCDPAYYDGGVGYWQDCFENIPVSLEESVRASRIRAQAFEYVHAHERRLPVVVIARLGRVWDVFRPGQSITANQLQNRPRPVGWAALFGYYALVPLAIAGAVLLRRRRVTLLPLASMVALVCVTAVVFYGNVRFRVPAEIVLIVLAAVALGGMRSVRAATRRSLR